MVYGEYLDLFSNVDSKVKDMEIRLSGQENKECKIIVERLGFFELHKLIPKIKKLLDNVRTFFETSYKGIYCTICDGENH